jgi:hypothetical protein
MEEIKRLREQLHRVRRRDPAASESDGGLGVKMVFERHIVYPNGHREIEGVTPKALPAPDASHALPSAPSSEIKANNIK